MALSIHLDNVKECILSAGRFDILCNFVCNCL